MMRDNRMIHLWPSFVVVNKKRHVLHHFPLTIIDADAAHPSWHRPHRIFPNQTQKHDKMNAASLISFRHSDSQRIGSWVGNATPRGVPPEGRKTCNRGELWHTKNMKFPSFDIRQHTLEIISNARDKNCQKQKLSTTFLLRTLSMQPLVSTRLNLLYLLVSTRGPLHPTAAFFSTFLLIIPVIPWWWNIGKLARIVLSNYVKNSAPYMVLPPLNIYNYK